MNSVCWHCSSQPPTRPTMSSPRPSHRSWPAVSTSLRWPGISSTWDPVTDPGSWYCSGTHAGRRHRSGPPRAIWLMPRRTSPSCARNALGADRQPSACPTGGCAVRWSQRRKSWPGLARDLLASRLFCRRPPVTRQSGWSASPRSARKTSKDLQYAGSGARRRSSACRPPSLPRVPRISRRSTVGAGVSSPARTGRRS